ncbi:DUF4972 domain-containing protein [Marinilabiliaceae bacterium JC017]|nr:DUF4972 domain-containing protein [Marinilabiliaceae bacterium JC017]
MKRFKFNVNILLLAIFASFAVVGCSDSDSDDEILVNKTALTSKITEAKTLIAESEEGTADGQYQPGSKAVLQASVDLAQAVVDDLEAEQLAVDNTVIALGKAIDAYDAQKVVPIAPEDLVGHWTFDDGTGKTVTDYSGNNFTGEFKNGPADWGAGFPEWTADRYGNEAKAILFDKGANIEVPYNTALNPSNLSISVWVRIDETRNNRFMGLHSWNGYKFEVQDANKPFFTVASTEDIHNRDTDPSLELNTWYHLVVTFGGGETVFYINGTETMRWDDTPGTAKPLATPYNLVFGQDFPTNKYAASSDNYDQDQIIPLAWGSYFHGAMDEVRIYKSVLSTSQVASIYNLEKVIEE